MRYQKMSLLEFEDICKKRCVKYYFASGDNPSLQDNSSISFTTQFDKMAVSLAPDVMMFKNDCNILSFHRIKSISVCNHDEFVSFKITCEIGRYNPRLKEYLMIADVVKSEH